jgi:hypothetical protein
MPPNAPHRLVHATAREKLSLAQVRLAPGAGHAQDRQRPERIELSEDEGRLEVPSGVVHGLVDRA